MNVSIPLEYRFKKAPDGSIWTQTAFTQSFWDRYLDIFSHVTIVARAHKVSHVGAEWGRVDSRRVTLGPVPYYLGFFSYCLNMPRVRRAVNKSYGPEDAVILRLPGVIGTHLWNKIQKSQRPYGVEVVGDPIDVFAPGTIKHPLRPFFRWWFSRQLRRQCAAASAVAYVTEKTIQSRYPAAASSFSTYYSSIELPKSAMVAQPRPMTNSGYPANLIFVGSLAQMYKAPDILIDAVGICLKEGLKLKLAMVGGGKYRSQLEARAAACGLRHRIQFYGQIPSGNPIRTLLDQADLFVLPSKTEGLPRAMIEAMARGLPCIGSSAGGIPELLPPEDMVPPGDAIALAKKIKEVVSDPGRMARMSARNLKKAKEYREELLVERRKAFYRYVKEKTEEWLSEKGKSERSSSG